MRKTLLVSVSALIVTLLAPSSSHAGDVEDALISKVVEAYGGADLTEAKSFSFTYDVRVGLPGQGYTPDYTDYNTERQILILDPKNQQGLTENWSNHRGAIFLNSNIINEDGGYSVNYRTGTYEANPEMDYYRTFGGFIRGHDTLLAYELNARADTATHVGSSNYLGRPHDEISFDFPSSPPLHLFVDKATGYISKMNRTVGEIKVEYTFDNHKKKNGIVYADDYIFFNQGSPAIIVAERNMSINKASRRDFKLNSSLTEAPAQYIPQEGMYVKALSETLHYVGQNGAHSVFLNAGDHIVAVGGYGGFADRFEAYKDETKSDKPLKYLVATHHHQDHIQGVPDAYELGATILVPPLAQEAIKEEIGGNVDEARIVDITQDQKMGEMMIHLAPTTHAAQNAFIYFPTIKAALSADHYGNNAVEGASPAFFNALSLHKVLDGLDWDIETLLDIHAQKPTNWQDFDAAVKAYDPSPCPSNRKICRDKL